MHVGCWFRPPHGREDSGPGVSSVLRGPEWDPEAAAPQPSPSRARNRALCLGLPRALGCRLGRGCPAPQPPQQSPVRPMEVMAAPAMPPRPPGKVSSAGRVFAHSSRFEMQIPPFGREFGPGPFGGWGGAATPAAFCSICIQLRPPSPRDLGLDTPPSPQRCPRTFPSPVLQPPAWALPCPETSVRLGCGACMGLRTRVGPRACVHMCSLHAGAHAWPCSLLTQHRDRGRGRGCLSPTPGPLQ